MEMKGAEKAGKCAVMPIAEQHCQPLLPTGSFKQVFLSLPFCSTEMVLPVFTGRSSSPFESFKPLFCFSSNTKLTAVWHLDATAIASHAVVAAHPLSITYLHAWRGNSTSLQQEPTLSSGPGQYLVQQDPRQQHQLQEWQ